MGRGAGHPLSPPFPCISLGHHNGIPQTGWLNNRNVSSQSLEAESLEVHESSASRVGFWWHLSPQLKRQPPSCCIFTVFNTVALGLRCHRMNLKVGDPTPWHSLRTMPGVSHEIVQILSPFLSTSSTLRDTDPYGLPGPQASGREMERRKRLGSQYIFPWPPSSRATMGWYVP